MSAFSREDRRLTTAVRAGDQRALHDLYRLHRPAALTWARRFAHRRDDLDDVVSEAFTRVLEAMRSGGGPDIALGPYLISTIRNVSVNRARDLDRTHPVDDLEPIMAMAPVPVAAADSLILRAFAELNEHRQLMFWLRNVEGLTPREAAKMIGLKASAATMLYQRAKTQLQQEYLTLSVADSLPDHHPISAEQLLAWYRRASADDQILSADSGTLTTSSTDTSSSDPRTPTDALTSAGMTDPVRAHVAACATCGSLISETQAVEARFCSLIPLLPTAAALGITVHEVVSESTRAAAPGVAAFAAVGAASIVVLGVWWFWPKTLPLSEPTGAPIAITEQVEVLNGAHDGASRTGGEVIVARTDGGGAAASPGNGWCEVTYHPADGVRSASFTIASISSTVNGQRPHCHAVIEHEGQPLAELRDIQGSTPVLAPRPGAYTVTVGDGVVEVVEHFGAP